MLEAAPTHKGRPAFGPRAGALLYFHSLFMWCSGITAGFSISRAAQSRCLKTLKNKYNDIPRGQDVNVSKFLWCMLALCLLGCDDSQPGDAKKPARGVAYYLSVALPPDAAPLTMEAVTAVTLLPVPAPSPTPEKSAPAVDQPSAAPFTELKMEVISLKLLEGGLYRLRLKESPQVDGVIRIRTGKVELQTLMLETGSRKRPIRVDAISTAAVRMFLKRVEAQRSYNKVDVEQVNTLLSVVNKHLATLDVPDKLRDEAQIAWYTQQAQKACTIYFSGLSSSAECAAFTLGGKVKGLIGQLQLVVNNGEPLVVAQDGPFMFPTGLINRTYYEVTVKEQPYRQTCVVKYGVGRIHAENVDSIIVNCDENRYQLTGAAEGVTGPVTLKLNGNAETLILRKDGAFQFRTMLRHGEAYEITLAHQPASLTCALSRGAGNVVDNVVDIAITCEPLLFAVGGRVSGLVGSLRLRINDSEELVVTQEGEFNFGSDFVHKAEYNVQIAEQPTGQTCQLTKGQGRLAFSDVRSVFVECATNQHTIAGTVAGLKGALTLSLNGAEQITLQAPGEFHFKNPLPYGSDFAVTVAKAPGGQQCEILRGMGTLTGDIADVQINCAAVQYRLGGVVSGLSGAFQLRLNNRQEVLAVPSNGPFEFATRMVSGQRYNVVMDTQPAAQLCVVSNGSGVVKAQDIENLRIECDFQSFKLGGSVTGLKGALKLVLNGGTDSLALTSNGMFAFSAPLQTGSNYNVEVAVQPVGQQCEVRKGQGQINAANIVDVKVICLPATAVQPPTTAPATSAPAAGEPAAEGPQTYAAPFPQVIKP